MTVRRVHPADAIVAAVAGFLMLMAGLNIDPGDRRGLDALGWTCLAVAASAILVRRSRPLPVLVVVTAALSTYTMRDYAGGPIYLVGAFALYSYAVTVDRRRATGSALVVATCVFVARSVAGNSSWLVLLMLVAWAAVAVLAADAIRSTGERRRMAIESRNAELSRRLAEDRLQIARDLHDSVAHAITVINVQAGVAEHLLDREPARVASALDTIKLTSREVLAELGVMLDVLRRGDADGGAPRSPLPRLSDLGGLVDTTALAGLRVELRSVGDTAAVSPAVSTVAYRVIQEALTNVVRHADTERSEVTVVAANGGLDVTVVNAGPAAVPSLGGTGRGLLGIRERVAGTGGTVDAGVIPGGGFEVRAQWPSTVDLPG